MTNPIPVQPIILTDVLLRIAEHQYQAHVSRVEFTPASAVTQRWKGLTPSSVHVFGGRSDWQVALDYAQDWENDQSLSVFLYEHEGETVACEFEPKAGGRSWTAQIVITPGAIGGQVDAVATGSVTLTSTRPERAAAAPAPEPDPEV